MNVRLSDIQFDVFSPHVKNLQVNLLIHLTSIHPSTSSFTNSAFYWKIVNCLVYITKAFKIVVSFHSFPLVNLHRENKDNQWLGVTVKSQGIGGKVVVSHYPVNVLEEDLSAIWPLV